MTIKLISYQRDPQNGDNVIATVQYDLPQYSGTLYQFNKDAPMNIVDGMTQNEIENWIIARVGDERGDQLWSDVDNKLGQIINKELEPQP